MGMVRRTQWDARVLREHSSGNSGHTVRKQVNQNRNSGRADSETVHPSRQRSKRSRPDDWEIPSDDMEDYNNQNTEQEVLRVARRVYVGNLSWRTSWQDLKDFFGRVGTVKYADVLREAGPGSRSKGCGIVEFETPEEAAAAIQQLNHVELDGRQVFVREDREDFELRNELGSAGGGMERASRGSIDPNGPPKRARGPPPGPIGGGGAVTIGRRVWVGNLGFDTTWQQLKDHFKAAGRVLHADILQDADGRGKGCGIVEFEQPADALRAISLLSNSTLDDRQIMVREDREDPGARSAAVGCARPLHMGLRGGSVPPPPPGSGMEGGTQLVVHGIPYRMAWQDLKDLCRAAGTVVRADVMTNPDGSSKGFGVVTFATPQDAAQGIAILHGRVVEGRVITCKYDRFANAGG